jgi:hypothetical protein
MSDHISPELQIMKAPQRVYSRLVAERQTVTALDACYRPMVVALTIGTAASISSTSHVSIGLVTSVTACWTFLVVVQVIAAWVAMPSASRRAIGSARAIDLLFSGHGPWSLWLLVAAAWALAMPTTERDTRWLLTSIAVPVIWNVVIVFAFFRAALQLPYADAVRRTIVHQAVALGSGLAVFGSAVAIWPRIVGIFAR